MQELGRARFLAVLLGVEPVGVPLAAAVVERHAALLGVVKVPELNLCATRIVK